MAVPFCLGHGELSFLIRPLRWLPRCLRRWAFPSRSLDCLNLRIKVKRHSHIPHRMKVFSIIAGIGLVLLSLVACGVSLVAIVDPTGAKMADDNNPFGLPLSRSGSVIVLCVSVVIGVAAAYVVRRSFRPRHHATQ